MTSIYRPRPGLPFTQYTLANGAKRLFWTTFTGKQIDIEVENAQGRAYLQSILERFREGGVREIRLDAARYAIKRRGTSCFMIPETYAFIGELTRVAREAGIEVMVEGVRGAAIWRIAAEPDVRSFAGDAGTFEPERIQSFVKEHYFFWGMVQR